jgi:hypothetical protein
VVAGRICDGFSEGKDGDIELSIGGVLDVTGS